MASSYSLRSHLKAFAVGIVLAGVGLAAYVQFGSSSSPNLPEVTVYKSPTCGCCTEWVSHLREHGLSVKVESRVNVQPVKRQLGVPSSLASCHTATVGNYVVEGHVPASDIKRLLRTAPEVRGLSVPGMPVGSPGMEQGGRVEPYEVVAFTSDGGTSVFAKYGGQ